MAARARRNGRWFDLRLYMDTKAYSPVSKVLKLKFRIGVFGYLFDDKASKTMGDNNHRTMA